MLASQNMVRNLGFIQLQAAGTLKWSINYYNLVGYTRVAHTHQHDTKYHASANNNCLHTVIISQDTTLHTFGHRHEHR